MSASGIAGCQQWRTLYCLFFFSQSFQLHLLCSLAISMVVSESSSASPLDPAGPVKPSTPLISFLERVQETAVNTFGKSNVDPKTYMDVSLKFSLSETEEAFDKLARSPNGSVPAKELNGFIERYLDGAGDDMDQPPLLSAMIYEIYKSTDDIELVKRSLPALRKEYEFWNSEIHRVAIVDPQGCTHTLNRYYAMWNEPRPEAYVKDKAFASKFLNVSEKQRFYRELASTCESGWDFSTRWLRDPLDFTSVATTAVIPVDLNAFILGMELNIAFLAKVTGDNSTAQRFLQLSDRRKKAINSVFWNPNMKQWLDYWLTNSTCQEAQVWEAHQQNKNVFASNFFPLWMEPFYSDFSIVGSVVESLKTCGLVRAAGIATSLTNSGQQWDFPNGWPQHQHMIVEGLVKSGLKEAASLGEEIARRWITTNYIAYKKSGVMHEKYDVEHFGNPGGGGLYVTQTGFGWSNGVVLAFLEEFGWPRDRNIEP